MFKLTTRQEDAVRLMKSKKSLFITGPAGTGKSAIIRTFVDHCNTHDIPIRLTSTTGSSAVLLGGETLHSFLGIGLGKESPHDMSTTIHKRKHLRTRWQNLQILVIDEISMMDPDLFDKLELVARIIRRSARPFGGIQLIVLGDFCQLTAVGTDSLCFEAESWSRTIKHTIYLNETKRQTDLLFTTILNKIRLGVIDRQVKDVIKSRVAVSLEFENGDQTDQTDQNTTNSTTTIIPTRLYCRNVNVDSTNEYEIEQLLMDGRAKYTYIMEIKYGEFRSARTDAIEQKLLRFCSAKKEIVLCEGAPVILIKNLDVECGLANGSRGDVIGFNSRWPIVRFYNPRTRQYIVKTIELETWEVKDENDQLQLRVQQLPLKIGYAVSIHSSQGMTLDCVSIDLSDVFTDGQAYTGLSRVKSLQGLTIERVNFKRLTANPLAVAFYTALEKSIDFENLSLVDTGHSCPDVSKNQTI